MGTVPTLEREFVDYKRQQEILQGVYLILLQKRRVGFEYWRRKDKALIIDKAFVKKKTVAQRKLLCWFGCNIVHFDHSHLSCSDKTLYIALKEEYKRTSK